MDAEINHSPLTLQQYLGFTTTRKHSFNSKPCIIEGVSIEFEVGSWLEKNNRLYEQGSVRPLTLGGLGACSPRKFRNLEALKCLFQHSWHQIITQAHLEFTVFAWPSDVK